MLRTLFYVTMQQHVVLFAQLKHSSKLERSVSCWVSSSHDDGLLAITTSEPRGYHASAVLQ